MNNILIVYYEDGEKVVTSFAAGKTEKEAVESIAAVSPRKIKKFFFVENATHSLEFYRSYCETGKNDTLEFDEISAIIDSKEATIREVRDQLLKQLDVPFMRAIEDDCLDCKEHVTKLKNFLRDVPDNLRFKELKKKEDFIYYNPFNNIFTIVIVNGGSGYTIPPSVTINAPDNDYFIGFQAEAVAFIKDGSVEKIEITNPGCGYHKTPVVSIDPPQENDGTQAIAVSLPPENAMETIENLALDSKEVRDWQEQAGLR